MTPRERAKDLVMRFDEPVMDKTNCRVQAMINMTEEAITAAVAEEREACEEIAQMYVNLIREVKFPEKGTAELIRNAILKRASESGADEG